jgi:hypothetical protein
MFYWGIVRNIRTVFTSSHKTNFIVPQKMIELRTKPAYSPFLRANKIVSQANPLRLGGLGGLSETNPNSRKITSSDAVGMAESGNI